MEGISLVIPLHFRAKGNNSPTSAMDFKGITRVLVGNYQGINMEYISIYVFIIYVV